MEVHFCDKCEYMTEISTEDDVLIHACNVCGYKKKVDKDDQYIYEISNESVKLLDKFEAEFESTPVVHNNRVYIASRNGNFYCFGN